MWMCVDVLKSCGIDCVWQMAKTCMDPTRKVSSCTPGSGGYPSLFTRLREKPNLTE